MWYTFYSWLEAISGKDYNYSEELNDLNNDSIFINPYLWSIKFDNIIDGLIEAVDILTTHADELPDELPELSDLKSSIISVNVDSLVDTISGIGSKIHLDINIPTSFDDLINYKTAICGLITMINDNDIDMINKHDMLDELNDECDNIITDIFNITIDDLYILQTTIQTIKQEYYNNQDYD